MDNTTTTSTKIKKIEEGTKKKAHESPVRHWKVMCVCGRCSKYRFADHPAHAAAGPKAARSSNAALKVFRTAAPGPVVNTCFAGFSIYHRQR
jgi:hypothetical protein